MRPSERRREHPLRLASHANALQAMSMSPTGDLLEELAPNRRGNAGSDHDAIDVPPTDGDVQLHDGLVPTVISLSDLRRSSQSFLLDVVREQDGLFPYSTTVRDGAYVNDFEHPAAVRYTINSLLGLQAVASRDGSGVDSTDVQRLAETFWERHGKYTTNPADLGLLLVLLSEGAVADGRLTDLLAAVRGVVRSGAARRLTMQDLSWMLWGACTAAHAGTDGASAVAVELGDVVRESFLDPVSMFPRHDLSRYRRDVVSFGALTYFLRAMFELYRLTDDPRAKRIFHEGVRATLTCRGISVSGRG